MSQSTPSNTASKGFSIGKYLPATSSPAPMISPRGAPSAVKGPISTAKKPSAPPMSAATINKLQQFSKHSTMVPAPPIKPGEKRSAPSPLDAWNGASNPFVDHATGACRSVLLFEKLGKLGEGTYGVVYQAKDKTNGDTVALKKVRMEREKDGIPVTTLREISILKSVSHPNIVKLKEIVVGNQSDRIFLVFEYLEHDLGGLIDVMKHPFTESEVKCLMLQLLKAVSYLHDRYIIHRDLKLSNLLLNNKGQLKLADFGLARLYGKPVQPYTPKVVTLWYRAPELLLGAELYTTAIDLWAVGCIMGELLSNAPLMPGTGELEQLQCMVRLLGTPHERIWADFPLLPGAAQIANLYQPYNNLSVRLPNISSGSVRLLDQLLTYDPAKRLNARQALAHTSFTQSPLPQDSSALPTFPINCHRTASTAAMAANKEEYRVAKRKLDDILPRASAAIDPHATISSTATSGGGFPSRFEDDF